MNKTISVNLGGSVFNIEEDAYQLLRDYLERIKSNFGGDSAEAEIMSDIEGRIAELLTQRLELKRNVVERRDVDEIIAIMGQPEDFRVDNEDSNHKSSTNDSSTRNNNRRFYRDKDDSRVGGVCSGLSHYLGWDPVILRIIFVILLFASAGTAFLVYLILWALVPAAETTAEKLQMRGESVNIDNISRFVSEEAKRAGDNISQWGKKTSFNEPLHVFGKIIVKVVGVFIFIFGLGLLIALLSLAFFSQISFASNQVDWNTLNTVLFNDDGSMWMLTLGIILVMGIPAISLMFTGVRLVVGSSRKIKSLIWAFASLFIIGVIMLAFGGIRFGTDWTKEGKMKTELAPTANDTLFVDAFPDTIFTGRSSDHQHDFFDLVRINKETITYGEPVNLNFESTRDSVFSVRIYRESRGPSLQEAGRKADNISYYYEQLGDSLMLSAFFNSPYTDKYRGQHVEIIVFVPEGKSVHFGKNVGLLYWDEEKAGKTFTMQNDDWTDHPGRLNIELNDLSIDSIWNKGEVSIIGDFNIDIDN